MRDVRPVLAVVCVPLFAGCAGNAGRAEATVDGGHAVDAARFALTPVDASSFPDVLDAGGTSNAADATLDAGVDATGTIDAAPDAPPSRFITQVVSFVEGTCAGYNADHVLATVAGPPYGGGADEDGTDVVSLGGGGSIIVGFGANAIVDGPGVDFIVFENPFDYGGTARYVEPGEVSVSDDGVHWSVFPCTDTTQAEPDGGYGATQCGGMNPVFANAATNDISPFDVAHAGGDQYDLATLGVAHARFVRIINKVSSEYCPEAGPLPTKNGFDLDAIAIVHAELP